MRYSRSIWHSPVYVHNKSRERQFFLSLARSIDLHRSPQSLLSPPRFICFFSCCTSCFYDLLHRHALNTGEYNRNDRTNEALLRVLINSFATCCHCIDCIESLPFVFCCVIVFSKLESMAKSSPLEVF